VLAISKGRTEAIGAASDIGKGRVNRNHSTSGVKSLSSLISGIAQMSVFREMAIGKDRGRTEFARCCGMPPRIPQALAS